MIRKELHDHNLPLVRPCLTCLIYVDVDSETFRKVVHRELQQQKEMICLYAGVVHEKRKAYISGQKGEYGQEEYQQMKEVVLKIFQKQEMYEPW